MGKQKTTESFIEKAILVHGEGTYDYSEVVYVDFKTKVKVHCLKNPEHGHFMVTPTSHISKGNETGCPKCAAEARKRAAQNRYANKQVSRDKLFEMFITNRRSVMSISKELNISRKTITKQLAAHGLTKDMRTAKPKKVRVARISATKKPTVKVAREKRNVAKIPQKFFGHTAIEWARKYSVSSRDVSKVEAETAEQFETMVQKLSPAVRPEVALAQHMGLELWNKPYSKDIDFAPHFVLENGRAVYIINLYEDTQEFYPKNHFVKIREQFEEAGKRIYFFTEDEVRDKMHIVSSVIRNASGIIEKKIGARKCEIRKVDGVEAREFLATNHMKGYMTAKNFGLYYNDELISFMSVKAARRHLTKEQKSNGVTEKTRFLKIERFASKAGYVIQGGLSKLLKYCEALPEYADCGQIEYWVDLRYGTGAGVEKLGYKFRTEAVGWAWTDGIITRNRLSCRANMDDRKLSENEHAAELGLVRVFDAGQRVLVKTREVSDKE